MTFDKTFTAYFKRFGENMRLNVCLADELQAELAEKALARDTPLTDEDYKTLWANIPPDAEI